MNAKAQLRIRDMLSLLSEIKTKIISLIIFCMVIIEFGLVDFRLVLEMSLRVIGHGQMEQLGGLLNGVEVNQIMVFF